jgi:hypothetical protein
VWRARRAARRWQGFRANPHGRDRHRPAAAVWRRERSAARKAYRFDFIEISQRRVALAGEPTGARTELEVISAQVEQFTPRGGQRKFQLTDSRHSVLTVCWVASLLP